MSSVRNSAIVAAVLVLATPIAMHFEGERYKTYIDPVGILTVCSGHTGPDVKLGQVWTAEQCKKILQEDLQEAFSDVERCVSVPLQINQAAAFTLLASNVGGKKFCSSALVKKANAGNMLGACAELSRWVYAGGKPLRGLVARRAKERSLCELKVG